MLGVVAVAILVDQMYRPTLEGMRSPEEVAVACKYTFGNEPPKPFVSDGCTLFPDTIGSAVLTKCCITHDAEYWCGGDPTYRARADAELISCVEREIAYAGTLMETGSRIGGSSLLPTPWRWGYGWPYGERGE